jgi:hypothetical protein
MKGVTKKETDTIFDTAGGIFETPHEKNFIYTTTMNPQLGEIDKMLMKEKNLLNSTFVHKLNGKLKVLHLFRKMQFGAHLILSVIPLLYAGFVIYQFVEPFDSFEVSDSKGNIEHISFNTGALIFGTFLQLVI